MNIRIIILLSFLLLTSCSQIEPPSPVNPIPTNRQLAWHELEMYAFVHFNMNTFTNMEWGMGSKSPELFNPTQLDCRQWAKICKEAGMKGIILTAKHHDGFCLWPSEYTEHSVKNSPWKDGNGDVVRELFDACKEYGLKFGVYLSPWDRNHADYGNPEYIEYYRNQLKELLSNYGEIFEVWFDGANGGTGWYGGANENRKIDNRTYYDWENTRKIVRDLQPNACMFSDAGPDVRWVGTEEGWARETNWCMLNKDSVAPGVVSNIEWLRAGQENGTDWVPAEVDVSIRPGWYYHAAEDSRVKTLPQLLDIYYNSVGRNASLLINFPVDQRGLIHEKDVEQIMNLANTIKTDFEVNLLAGKKATATNIRGNSKIYAPENITDGNSDTYWATDDSVRSASLTFNFDNPVEFNRFLVQEEISLGQRVKQFSIEALVDNSWQTISVQTTIGRKRILRFENVMAQSLRFNVIDSRACPVILNMGIFKAPKVLVEPEITRNKDGLVTIQTFDTGLDVFYTIDGNNPNQQSSQYSKPFYLNEKATLKAIAFDSGSGNQSEITAANFDIPKTKWKMEGEFSSVEMADFIFDGDPKTAWTLRNTPPVDFVIDLGEPINLKGFTYLPDQGRWESGVIFNYEFYVSSDGKKWGSPVSKGEFANIKNSPILQKKEFEPVIARYVKLLAVSPAEVNGSVGIAEFDIISK